MGTGQNNSFRFSPDRVLSTTEQANYWQSKYLQMKSERDTLDKHNISLALQVSKLNKELGEYHRSFGPMFIGGEKA